MEDLGSYWNYQESFDELKLKLQYTAIELESVKMEAVERTVKYKEELKLIVNLLNLAYKERDEARDQLQKLLNKLMPYETPLMIAAKTNSSITESNSSSPVDSLFDAVTSPDFPTFKMPDSSGMGLLNQPFGCLSTGLVPPLVSTTKVADVETALIDDLSKGKTLPEKGKLLHAVMEAGPLLSTLLVAGPLPQWRNPPPSDTFRIPAASINGFDSKINIQIPVANPNNRAHQKCSSGMLSFGSSASASWLSHSRMVSSDAGVNTQVTVTKRQRPQLLEPCTALNANQWQKQSDGNAMKTPLRPQLQQRRACSSRLHPVMIAT
ncbi:hypothetical protein V6N11_026225 [Hibiscus sabdariffa]|uniref:TOX high mobility group box family member 4-A n=1 Tax=Hibiscus sabdariffa TaxID=183260 RepID=A0ABR2SVB9_9ROSI